jgi:hypothetical protein
MPRKQRKTHDRELSDTLLETVVGGAGSKTTQPPRHDLIGDADTRTDSKGQETKDGNSLERAERDNALGADKSYTPSDGDSSREKELKSGPPGGADPYKPIIRDGEATEKGVGTKSGGDTSDKYDPKYTDAKGDTYKSHNLPHQYSPPEYDEKGHVK